MAKVDRILNMKKFTGNPGLGYSTPNGSVGFFVNEDCCLMGRSFNPITNELPVSLYSCPVPNINGDSDFCPKMADLIESELMPEDRMAVVRAVPENKLVKEVLLEVQDLGFFMPGYIAINLGSFNIAEDLDFICSAVINQLDISFTVSGGTPLDGTYTIPFDLATVGTFSNVSGCPNAAYIVVDTNGPGVEWPGVTNSGFEEVDFGYAGFEFRCFLVDPASDTGGEPIDVCNELGELNPTTCTDDTRVVLLNAGGEQTEVTGGIGEWGINLISTPDQTYEFYFISNDPQVDFSYFCNALQNGEDLEFTMTNQAQNAPFPEPAGIPVTYIIPNGAIQSFDVTNCPDSVSFVVERNFAGVQMDPTTGSSQSFFYVPVDGTGTDCGTKTIGELRDIILSGPQIVGSAKIDTNGNIVKSFELTSTKVSVGEYNVFFNTPRADADYQIQLTGEDTAGRDDIVLHYDNQSTAGFKVFITEQDNSGNPGVSRDRNFCVAVIDF